MMFNIVHTESEQFSWCWQKKNRKREAEQEENNELRNRRRRRSDQGNLLVELTTKHLEVELVSNELTEAGVYPQLPTQRRGAY